MQCVGAWSRDKHDYLKRYLEASGNPRRKYLPPEGAGAAFVDLFAGPGRARVKSTGELVDVSPLIALKQAKPFSKALLCELDPENVSTLERRTVSFRPRVDVRVIPGDSNESIDQVVREVPRFGLNLAWVDPYRLALLRFDTIGRQLRRYSGPAFLP